MDLVGPDSSHHITLIDLRAASFSGTNIVFAGIRYKHSEYMMSIVREHYTSGKRQTQLN